MRKEIPSGHRSHQRMCQTLVESHFPICLPFPFNLSAKSVSFGCVSFCIQQKSWESNASMIKLVYIMIWIHCVFKFDIMHCVSACTDSIRWAIWSQRNGCFAPKVITISTLNAILWKKWSVIFYGLFSILPFSPDMSTLTSDLPTLLGVSTGIAVLAGLICLVLHLFSKTKYPRHRHFNDNNLPPPIMYSSDTGNSNSSTKTIQLNRKKNITNTSNRWMEIMLIVVSSFRPAIVTFEHSFKQFIRFVWQSSAIKCTAYELDWRQQRHPSINIAFRCSPFSRHIAYIVSHFCYQ